MEHAETADLIGEEVVIDTATSYIYVGTLKAWGDEVVVLESVDVHDTAEGRSTKDLYALEARRNGIQKNRREARVMKRQVVGLSRLKDVILY